MEKSLKLDVLSSGVAVLTIDVPGSKLNVLSTPFMTELNETLDALATNSAVKGLVIISGKEDNFFAGANIDEIVDIQKQPSKAAFNATQLGKAIFAKIENLPYLTVAAIHGVCLGGGFELALACKRRLATKPAGGAKKSKTKLGLPEVGLGFLPGWGGVVRLTRMIGVQAALDIILKPLGTLDAHQAWKRGIVDEVVEEGQLLTRAIEVAQGAKVRRASKPLMGRVIRFALEGNPLGRYILNKMYASGIQAETRGNYPAPPATLKVAMAALTMPRDKAFEFESASFARLAVTDESQNLVGVYNASQEAKKTPDGAKPNVKVETVGVIGAGVMGSGIAQSAAYAGFNVVLYDIDPAGLEKGRKAISILFDGLLGKDKPKNPLGHKRRKTTGQRVKSVLFSPLTLVMAIFSLFKGKKPGKLTQAEVDEIAKRITYTTKLEDLVDCDLCVEAIVENLKVKQDTWVKLEQIIRAKHGRKLWVRASNTSSLKVQDQALISYEMGMFGGLHFFNPVHKMPLVEVVAAPCSDPATIATLKWFAQKINKTAVTCGDAPGFIDNRILTPYLYEAIKMAEAGVPIEDIEKAMKSFGFPMGPFELLDTVGLDIISKVIEVMASPAGIGPRVTPPPVLMGFIKQHKLLGKKGCKGLYLYDEDERKIELNREVLAVLPEKKVKKSQGEIQDRLVLTMINEAAMVLEEGVADTASQVDLALIMGTGFPPFRGGLLRYADKVGVAAVVQKLSWLEQVAGENYRPCALLKSMAEKGETFYA